MEQLEIISIHPGDEELKQKALDVRRKVFVEEQQIDATLEYDAYDASARHYVALLNGEAVGAARWRQTESGIKLERFAVLKTLRNMHIGQKILDRVMEEVKPLNTLIYLHSQVSAMNFYLRNNFEKTGEPFFEAGIEHYKMVYKS